MRFSTSNIPSPFHSLKNPLPHHIETPPHSRQGQIIHLFRQKPDREHVPSILFNTPQIKNAGPPAEEKWQADICDRTGREDEFFETGGVKPIERLRDTVAVAEGGLSQLGRGVEAGPEVIWG